MNEKGQKSSSLQDTMDTIVVSSDDPIVNFATSDNGDDSAVLKALGGMYDDDGMFVRPEKRESKKEAVEPDGGGDEDEETTKKVPAKTDGKDTAEPDDKDESDSDEGESEDVEDDKKDDDVEKDIDEDDEDTVSLNEDQITRIFGVESSDDIKVDEDGKVLFRTKVKGEEEFVTVDKMRTSYQTQKYLTQKSQEHAEEVKQFAQKREEMTQEFTSAVTDATAIVLHLEDRILKAYGSAELATLRHTDPGRWAAVNAEIEQQKQQLAGVKKAFHDRIQQQKEKYEALMIEEHEKRVAHEIETLLSKVPEWSDPKDGVQKAEQEVPKVLKATAEKYGFAEQELNQVIDHRMILMMSDAIKFQANRATSDNVRDKLVKLKVPKVVKSGSRRQSPKTVKSAKAKENRAKLRSTGSLDALAAVLGDITN